MKIRIPTPRIPRSDYTFRFSVIYVTALALAMLLGCQHAPTLSFEVPYRETSGLDLRVQKDRMILRSMHGVKVVDLQTGVTLAEHKQHLENEIPYLSADGYPHYNLEERDGWLYWVEEMGDEADTLQLMAWNYLDAPATAISKGPPATDRIITSPDKGAVIIFHNQTLKCWDVQAGKAKWEQAGVPYFAFVSAATIDSILILAGNRQDSAYVIDIKSGRLISVFQCQIGKRASLSPHVLPTAPNSALITQGAKMTHFQLPGGSKKWEREFEARITEVVLLGDQSIVAMFGNGTLYRISVRDGRIEASSTQFRCNNLRKQHPFITASRKRIVLQHPCPGRRGFVFLDSESLEETGFWEASPTYHLPPILDNNHLIFQASANLSIQGWDVSSMDAK